MAATLDPVTAFSLAGKVVILTGASSGLGRRFARCLGAAGASVVLTARRADRLASLVEELPDARAVPCDLTADGAPAELLAAALDHYGQIDVVVNNAGISRVLAAVDDDLDDFRQELEINLVAPYELARLAAKHLLDTGRPGSIINIGSVLGHGGGGRLKVPGYAAAKGGLHNLTRELASQWARKGIRVNGIGPGWFETEMNEHMFATDGGMAYIVDNTPMGRPGVEGELDGALLFLASDASSFVTGQVIFVDGGWTAI
ncbi:MAG: SDR family oxidoreductase [Acidimicrobiia bacterium]|nr:SDR family oxidoreductase [Acidimicrobiia bacterium]